MDRVPISHGHAGHCDCVKHTMKFQRPLLITGGGGYTKSNVARCWTNETAALVQKDISPRLPHCKYDEYFSVKDQDPTLRLKYSGEKPCDNLNKQEDINRLFAKVMSRLEDIRTKPTSSGTVSLSAHGWCNPPHESNCFCQDGSRIVTCSLIRKCHHAVSTRSSLGGKILATPA